MFGRRIIVAGVLAAAMCITNSAQALNTWTGADANSPTDWYRPGNWDLSTVRPVQPGGNTVQYYLTGNKTININPDPNLTAYKPSAGGLRLCPAATDAITLNINAGALLTMGTTGLETTYLDSASFFPTDTVNIYGTIDSTSAPVRLGRKGNSTINIYGSGKIITSSANRVELQGGNSTVNVNTGGYLSTGYFDLGVGNSALLYPGRGGNTTAILNSSGTVILSGTTGLGVGGLTVSGPSQAVVNCTGGYFRVGSSTASANIYMPLDLTCKKSVVNVSGGRLNVSGSVTRPAGALRTDLDRQFNITGAATNVSIRYWDDLAGNLTQTGGIFSPATYVASNDSYNEISRTDFGTSSTVSYTQGPDATIQINIGGSTPSDGTIAAGRHDVIASTGTISIAGSLKVGFRENYSLFANNVTTFTVITATAGITGGFSNLTGDRVNVYDAPGAYQGTYKVTNTGTSIVLSSYSATNLPPVITMNNIYTYPAPKSVAITPTVTDESLSTVTYVWSIVSKPAGSFFSNSSITPNILTKNITAALDVVGDYTLQLTATDSLGKIGIGAITIRVGANACAAAKLMPTFTPLVGDINADCKVNIVDLGLMMNSWLSCNRLGCP
jgi:hypothetical protein